MNHHLGKSNIKQVFNKWQLYWHPSSLQRIFFLWMQLSLTSRNFIVQRRRTSSTTVGCYCTWNGVDVVRYAVLCSCCALCWRFASCFYVSIHSWARAFCRTIEKMTNKDVSTWTTDIRRCIIRPASSPTSPEDLLRSPTQGPPQTTAGELHDRNGNWFSSRNNAHLPRCNCS